MTSVKETLTSDIEVIEISDIEVIDLESYFDPPRYKISKLVKRDRDLSVAESMPWAQKQKDKENRPDHAYIYAAEKGHLEIVKVLLKDNQKKNAILKAARNGDFKRAQSLPQDS